MILCFYLHNDFFYQEPTSTNVVFYRPSDAYIKQLFPNMGEWTEDQFYAAWGHIKRGIHGTMETTEPYTLWLPSKHTFYGTIYLPYTHDTDQVVESFLITYYDEIVWLA